MKRGRNAGLLRVIQLQQRLSGLRYAPSLEQLAADYGVNPRTIRRDLELLEEAGVQLPRWRFREIAA